MCGNRDYSIMHATISVFTICVCVYLWLFSGFIVLLYFHLSIMGPLNLMKIEANRVQINSIQICMFKKIKGVNKLGGGCGGLKKVSHGSLSPDQGNGAAAAAAEFKLLRFLIAWSAESSPLSWVHFTATKLKALLLLLVLLLRCSGTIQADGTVLCHCNDCQVNASSPPPPPLPLLTVEECSLWNQWSSLSLSRSFSPSPCITLPPPADGVPGLLLLLLLLSHLGYRWSPTWHVGWWWLSPLYVIHSCADLVPCKSQEDKSQIQWQRMGSCLGLTEAVLEDCYLLVLFHDGKKVVKCPNDWFGSQHVHLLLFSRIPAKLKTNAFWKNYFFMM